MTAGTTVDLGSNIFYADSHYAINQGGEASFVEGKYFGSIKVKSQREIVADAANGSVLAQQDNPAGVPLSQNYAYFQEDLVGGFRVRSCQNVVYAVNLLPTIRM